MEYKLVDIRSKAIELRENSPLRNGEAMLVQCGLIIDIIDKLEAAEQTLAPDVCRACGANLVYTTKFENNVPVCGSCGTRR